MNDGLRGRLMPWLLLNQDDKKPPKGFEKFFKKREEQSASNTEGNINLSSQPTFQIQTRTSPQLHQVLALLKRNPTRRKKRRHRLRRRKTQSLRRRTRRLQRGPQLKRRAGKNKVEGSSLMRTTIQSQRDLWLCLCLQVQGITLLPIESQCRKSFTWSFLTTICLRTT